MVNKYATFLYQYVRNDIEASGNIDLITLIKNINEVDFVDFVWDASTKEVYQADLPTTEPTEEEIAAIMWAHGSPRTVRVERKIAIHPRQLRWETYEFPVDHASLLQDIYFYCEEWCAEQGLPLLNNVAGGNVFMNFLVQYDHKMTLACWPSSPAYIEPPDPLVVS